MKKIITILILVASGATGWILLEPTLSDDIVNEEPVVDFSTDSSAQDSQLPEDGTIDQSTEQSTEVNSQQNTATLETNQDVVLDTNTDSDLQINPTVRSGSFTNGKPRYVATGQVYVSGSDLSLVDLNSTNVPDGFVYLANGLDINDAVRVEKLKGNVGNQNYTIPTSVNADDYSHVLIWCRAFGSLIGYAEIN